MEARLSSICSCLPILFLGEPGAGRNAGIIQGGAFWTILLGILVAGTARLVRDRSWDRLGSSWVWGPAGLSLFLVAGAAGLRPLTNRYGLFLVAPLAFTCAALVRATDRRAVSPARGTVRSLQAAGLLAVAWGLLLCYQHNFIDVFQGNAACGITLDASKRRRGPSVRSASRGPARQPPPGPGPRGKEDRGRGLRLVELLAVDLPHGQPRIYRCSSTHRPHRPRPDKPSCAATSKRGPTPYASGARTWNRRWLNSSPPTKSSAGR